MKLSFDEIKDWEEFEDLVGAYFNGAQHEDFNNLVKVEVSPSGKGSDGGRDILLTFELNDSIFTFTRKWVVQCKFYERSVGKRELANVNIPSLIHEYNAVGYLLIVKNDITSQLQDQFDRLNKNCKFGYKYEVWRGREFLEEIHKNTPNLLEHYFPDYYAYKRTFVNS